MIKQHCDNCKHWQLVLANKIIDPYGEYFCPEDIVHCDENNSMFEQSMTKTEAIEWLKEIKNLIHQSKAMDFDEKSDAYIALYLAEMALRKENKNDKTTL